MRASTLEGAALCLILGVVACADSLSVTPGGMAALVGGVAAAGLMVHLAHASTREAKKAKQPFQIRRHLRIWGKRNAAEVVATPQRRVKQSDQASISRPYFTGAEGVCQVWNGTQRGENRSLCG